MSWASVMGAYGSLSRPAGFARLLVLPEILKALWRQFGIADGMLDVPGPQILLQCPGIDPLVA